MNSGNYDYNLKKYLSTLLNMAFLQSLLDYLSSHTGTLERQRKIEKDLTRLRKS
jgi:hypothetical protein